MPTPASQMALDGLRDLSTLKWYVIPLLAIVFYIYATEIKKARTTGNWNAVYAGLTLFLTTCCKKLMVSGVGCQVSGSESAEHLPARRLTGRMVGILAGFLLVEPTARREAWNLRN